MELDLEGGDVGELQHLLFSNINLNINYKSISLK
jgi:hypothetical protein